MSAHDHGPGHGIGGTGVGGLAVTTTDAIVAALSCDPLNDVRAKPPIGAVPRLRLAADPAIGLQPYPSVERYAVKPFDVAATQRYGLAAAVAIVVVAPPAVARSTTDTPPFGAATAA